MNILRDIWEVVELAAAAVVVGLAFAFFSYIAGYIFTGGWAQ